MRVLIDTPKPAQLVPGRLLVAKASTRAVFAPTPRKASMLPVAWRIVSIAPEQMKLNPQKKHEKSALGHSEKPVKLITYINPPKPAPSKLMAALATPVGSHPGPHPLNLFGCKLTASLNPPWVHPVTHGSNRCPEPSLASFVSMCLIA